MSIYTAPTELNGTTNIEHMSQKDWDTLVEQRRRKFERSIGEKVEVRWFHRWTGERFVTVKPPSIKTVASEIPNRDPINLIDWVFILLMIVGLTFTSIKIVAAAVPYANEVLKRMTQSEGAVDPTVANIFIVVAASMFVLAAGPSVIFNKIVDHLPATREAKKRTAMTFDRWPEGWEWITWPVQAVMWMLSFDWLTPRLPGVITYFSVGWLIYISISGGGNVFEMFLPILIEVGLADRIAGILEKIAAYRGLVLDAWEKRLQRYKYRRQNYMADQQFLEGLFADIREKLISIRNGQTRPNAWLEKADAQVIDNAVLAEFRRFTGGQKFAGRVQELDYTKALVAGEERVPPNGTAWTPETLYTDIMQHNTKGTYSEADLTRDYGSKYKARTAWRNGARQKYEQTS